MRCNFYLNANSFHFPFVLLFGILLALWEYLAGALQTISGDLLVTKVIARRLLVQYCILLCGQFHTATANISRIFCLVALALDFRFIANNLQTPLVSWPWNINSPLATGDCLMVRTSPRHTDGQDCVSRHIHLAWQCHMSIMTAKSDFFSAFFLVGFIC